MNQNHLVLTKNLKLTITMKQQLMNQFLKKTEPQEEVQPKKKLPPGAKGMFGGGLMSELNAKLKKRNTES